MHLRHPLRSRGLRNGILDFARNDEITTPMLSALAVDSARAYINARKRVGSGVAKRGRL